MATFLETVVDHTRQLVDERRAALSEADLRARMGAVPRNRPFSEALVSEGISLIAEMKRSSPSRGGSSIPRGTTISSGASTPALSGMSSASRQRKQ